MICIRRIVIEEFDMDVNELPLPRARYKVEVNKESVGELDTSWVNSMKEVRETVTDGLRDGE